MNSALLLENYARIADAPDAIARLRRFVLDLAVRGKLVEQDAEVEAATSSLKTANVKDFVEHPKLVGWAEAKIGQLLQFQYGKGLQANERQESGAVPVFGSNGIVAYTHTALTDKPSIIVGRKGSAGALNLCSGPSWTTDVAYFVEAPTYFSLRYLLLSLSALGLDQLGKGVKPGLSRSDAYALAMGVPPLAEQHRIVGKVDELMALCDQLEAARESREAERDKLTAASFARLSPPDPKTFPADASFALANLTPLTTRADQIKQLRQTILNLALRGELVEQHANEGTVCGGLKQIKEDPPYTAPEGWQWIPFSELASFKNGDRSSKYPKRSEYVSEGMPWINTGHIQPDGTLSKDSMFFISPEKFASLGGGKIQPGDLVYCLRGATFGKTAYVEPYAQGAIASSLMIIRPGPHLDRRYAYIFLTSPFGKEQLKRFDNGTAQPNLSAANVKKYQIPLPPLAEQSRIVAKVDELMALCDQLEASIAQGEQTRSRLLESVLHHALEPA